uniref:m7GpppX diphosphatase n=1 Tax=Strigamia maritima TaxID=126957 RepID=T1J643_STRMM
MSTKKREDEEISIEIPSKKVKLDEDKIIGGDDVIPSFSSFDGFNIKSVLNEDLRNNMACVWGSFGDDQSDAVILMNKTPFDKDQLPRMLSKDSSLKAVMQNDLYGTYICSPPPETNSIAVTVIHPATELHVKKYSSHPMYLIEETPEDYQEITLPFINKQQLSLKWIDNIFEHKSETERIIHEDLDLEIGFILLPDMKWNQKQMSNLYIIAISKLRILSIRELTAEHIPLLENIDKTTKKIIRDKYGINSNQLRVYFHYQPSYYHLHVHFTHIHYEAPGSSCDKSHLLTTVVENLRRDSKYYTNSILPFRIREDSPLYNSFKDADIKIKIKFSGLKN